MGSNVCFAQKYPYQTRFVSRQAQLSLKHRKAVNLLDLYSQHAQFVARDLDPSLQIPVPSPGSRSQKRDALRSVTAAAAATLHVPVSRDVT